VSDSDLSSSSTLRDYLRNLSREEPNVKLKFPKWDVCVVLRALRRTPFEPLETVDLKFLTFKTVFLIALATAARVSELAALSAEQGFVKIKEDKSEMRLRPFDGFLAKNQRAEEPPRELVIRSLRHYAPPDDPERLLCPVRALSTYLKRTNKHRGARKRLFLALKENCVAEIGANTISRWIREAIKLAYQLQAPLELESLFCVTAHEVRAISTSLVAWRNASIIEVLRSACWKNHNTFTDFYLRDMCLVAQKLKRSGRGVVCAGRELSLDL
jgi:hypothetical protein